MIRPNYRLLLSSLSICCGCTTTQDTPVYGNTASMQSSNITSAGEPAPPLESACKVNEHDCSKSIDLTAGNLRCK
jgi:hypothetical protein